MACWPLTFGVFSVKNDAIHYFLPYRFQVSEALRNGEWPFWSPYLFMGFPVYGDMQSGAWNPVVWLFSLIGRYDATLFHFENLLYVFLGGMGMHKLVFYKVRHAYTALLVGGAYMLSGFMLSGQLINWLAAAAFIPFILLYYMRATSGGRKWDAVKSGFAMYMLLVAGYPSFFILMIYALLVMFVIRVIENSKKRVLPWKSFLTQHLIMILVFSGLSLPAIISFAELLPYYQRGDGTSFNDAIHNSLQWQHVLSFLFPSSIHANDVYSGTDVTCRNLYIGILTLPVLFAFPPKKNRRNLALLLCAILAFLFSLGDTTPVRKLAFDLLPGMDTFRHPSQARLFVMIALLLLAAPGIRKLLNHPSDEVIRRTRFVTLVFTCCILFITIIAFVHSDILHSIPAMAGTFKRIKQLIETVSLQDVVAINGLVQLATLIFFTWWLNQKQRKAGHIALVWILNLVVLAQFILPVTFVSMTPASAINQVIHASPSGYPVDDLQKSLEKNSADMFAHFDRAGLATFYNKKMGISRNTNTPTFLVQQDSLLAHPAVYRFVETNPFVFLATGTRSLSDSLRTADISCIYSFIDSSTQINDCSGVSTVIVEKLSANSIELKTEAKFHRILTVSQNYHKDWKVFVDGIEKRIFKVNIACMGVDLEPGTHSVKFRFRPSNTIIGMWIQWATALTLIVFFIISKFRRKNSKPFTA